jgi:hypothetical protein
VYFEDDVMHVLVHAYMDVFFTQFS